MLILLIELQIVGLSLIGDVNFAISGILVIYVSQTGLNLRRIIFVTRILTLKKAKTQKPKVSKIAAESSLAWANFGVLQISFNPVIALPLFKLNELGDRAIKNSGSQISFVASHRQRVHRHSIHSHTIHR